jgi:hypothetical protein
MKSILAEQRRREDRAPGAYRQEQKIGDEREHAAQSLPC